MKKLKISAISIIWLCVMIYFKTPFLLPLMCAIAIHELGHIVTARVLKIEIKRFHLSILGAALETKGEISYVKELLLAMGGPLFGTLGSILGFAFLKTKPDLPATIDFIQYFSTISIVITIFNLIPLATLDGGRILKCIAYIVFPLTLADKIIKLFSFFTLFALWLFSVYAMLKLSQGVPTFVFCSIFFVKCFVLDTKNGVLTSF